MYPKQKQNANWSQVEIENLTVRGRNLPRTNSTKSENQNIFAKKQQNEHTPPQIIKILIDIARSSDEVRSKETAQGWAQREKWCLLWILFNYDNLKIIKY